jgi:hypothetical protein
VSLYMETTRIAAAKTAGEIQGVLAGTLAVTGIATEFDAGEVCGLSFRIEVGGAQQTFRMPIRPDPIYREFQGRRTRNDDSKRARDREQAVRVAWRQVLMWIKAQVALIDTGMVDAGEVFLPYLEMDQGRTLYQIAAERIVQGQKLLAPPEARS